MVIKQAFTKVWSWMQDVVEYSLHVTFVLLQKILFENFCSHCSHQTFCHCKGWDHPQRAESFPSKLLLFAVPVMQESLTELRKFLFVDQFMAEIVKENCHDGSYQTHTQNQTTKNKSMLVLRFFSRIYSVCLHSTKQPDDSAKIMLIKESKNVCTLWGNL